MAARRLACGGVLSCYSDLILIISRTFGAGLRFGRTLDVAGVPYDMTV